MPTQLETFLGWKTLVKNPDRGSSELQALVTDAAPAPAFAPAIPVSCPPASAAPCDVAVYLACVEVDDADDGFKTAHERGVYLGAQGEVECRRHGLSVFLDEKACRHLIRVQPRGRKIASGKLGNDRGVIQSTPTNRHPNHHTWWPFHEIVRSAGFSLIV